MYLQFSYSNYPSVLIDHSSVFLFLQVFFLPILFSAMDHLVGLVVKASASRAEDPGSIPALAVGILQVKLYQWFENW